MLNIMEILTCNKLFTFAVDKFDFLAFSSIFSANELAISASIGSFGLLVFS